MTPRGCKLSVAQSLHCSVSHFVYVWRGKNCPQILRAKAVVKALQLNEVLRKEPKLAELYCSGTYYHAGREVRGCLSPVAPKSDMPLEDQLLARFGLLSDLSNRKPKGRLLSLTSQRNSYLDNFTKVECKGQREGQKVDLPKPDLPRLDMVDLPKLSLPSLKPKVDRLSLNKLTGIDFDEFEDRFDINQYQRGESREKEASFSGREESVEEQLLYQGRQEQQRNPRQDKLRGLSEDCQSFDLPQRPELKLNLNFSPIMPEQDSEAKAATGSLFPPRLNIRGLNAPRPAMPLTYEDILNQEDNNEISNTDRHELKMQHFSKDCSEVEPGLFVAGEQVTNDLALLKSKGITHVVNCAGDYCPNHFPGEFKYTTFFLKDSQNQNIECLFHQVCRLVDRTKAEGGAILIHCIQGVSRSVTIAMSYLIYSRGFDFKEAEAFIKAKRGVASPNNGFMVQLMQFHKRLYQSPEAIPLPRVFALSSHQAETPNLIVARFQNARFYEQHRSDTKRKAAFDPRGMFIVQGDRVGYIWAGSRLEGDRLSAYSSKAESYVRLLQEKEGFPQTVSRVVQGREGRDFWQLFNVESGKAIQNREWDVWYREGGIDLPAGANRRQYSGEEDQEESVKRRLYIHPDLQTCLGVFDMQDLREADLAVVVRQDKEGVAAFSWRSRGCKVDQLLEQGFLRRIMKKHYSEHPADSVVIRYVEEGRQSQDLLDLLN